MAGRRSKTRSKRRVRLPVNVATVDLMLGEMKEPLRALFHYACRFQEQEDQVTALVCMYTFLHRLACAVTDDLAELGVDTQEVLEALPESMISFLDERFQQDIFAHPEERRPTFVMRPASA